MAGRGNCLGERGLGEVESRSVGKSGVCCAMTVFYFFVVLYRVLIESGSHFKTIIMFLIV